jgi:transposase-like protein
MEQEIQRYWAEHVVRMLNHIFPQGSVETWTQCQRYLPHAIICAKLIERWHMTFVEAGSLLYGIAHYLHERSHYRQAEPLYRQALYIQQQNKVDLCIVHSLNSLAILYYETGQGTLAEPLCQQALSIMEHPDIAETLHDFARFRWMNQQSTEALSLYQQALRMREQTLGADHHKTKETRADYARLLHELGQIDEVEQFAHASHAKIQTANMSDNAELTVEQSRARYPMCPTCQQNESVVRSGINRIGTQRFRCCSCQRYFTPNAKKRGYDATTKAQARTLALTGIRTREIAQQLNVHHSTISLWIKQDQQ